MNPPSRRYGAAGRIYRMRRYGQEEGILDSPEGCGAMERRVAPKCTVKSEE